MNLRQLVTASALYGFADVLVLGVGGFLLLPLYTHTLTQAEFGGYVVVKANTEIIGYILFLGLPSAIARLYFDYRDRHEAHAYFNSILIFFVALSMVAIAILAVIGDRLWHLLSPSTPSNPLLWYSFGIAVATFIAGLGTLWLRLDNRVNAFVAIQVVAAATLTVVAFVNLVVFKLGLPGLLIALVAGYLPGAGFMFYRLRHDFRLHIRWNDLAPSLHYGLPFAISYIGYFVLNRFSLLILQRHVPIDQIAVFGLAQQLAVLISIVAQSFGKALQPMVFGADAADAPEILRRSSRLYIVLIFGTASGVVMFANEIIRIVAPRSYLSGFDVLLVLLIASFAYSLGLVSNTTIELYRRPRISAAVSILGAAMSVVLGLILIPRFGLMGGALATLGAYATTTLIGHIVAYRLSHQSYFAELGVATAVLCGMALVAAWPGWSGMNLIVSTLIKASIAGAIFVGLAATYVPQRFVAALAAMRTLLHRQRATDRSDPL